MSGCFTAKFVCMVISARVSHPAIIYFALTFQGQKKSEMENFLNIFLKSDAGIHPQQCLHGKIVDASVHWRKQRWWMEARRLEIASWTLTPRRYLSLTEASNLFYEHIQAY